MVIPYKKIFTSPAVYGLMLTHFGQNWAFLTIMIYMPFYMSDVLHTSTSQVSRWYSYSICYFLIVFLAENTPFWFTFSGSGNFQLDMFGGNRQDASQWSI